MSIIVGADLSLTATGLATHQYPAPTNGPATTVQTENTPTTWPDERRWAYLIAAITTITDKGQALVIIEAPFNMPGRGRTQLDLAALHAVIRYALWRRGVPYVYVTPATLKMYATGSGNSTKDQVLLQAERRLGQICPVADRDQADALWLAAMALDQYGTPLCPMPATHRRALTTPTWPATAMAGVT